MRRKVSFFMMTTSNGMYERGPWTTVPNAIDWHVTNPAFDAFAADQLGVADLLVFGRVTYEGMASYWPTPEAIAADPVVAEKMNNTPKLVASRTKRHGDWQNTRFTDDIAGELRRLREAPGKELLVLGSSVLAAHLAGEGLLDEVRLMVNPVLLGAGTPVLSGLAHDVKLRLLHLRTFTNGNVLLTYAPTTSA